MSALATPPPDGDLDEFLRSLQKSGDSAPPAPPADQTGSSLSDTHQGQSSPPTINDANQFAATTREESLEGGTSGAPSDAAHHLEVIHPGGNDAPSQQTPVEDVISARSPPQPAPTDDTHLAATESVVSYPSSSPAALGFVTRDPGTFQLAANTTLTAASGGELTTGSIAEVVAGDVIADVAADATEQVEIQPIPPTGLTVEGGSVQENAAAGTVAATLAAIDPDSTTGFTYSLTSDPSGLFEVVGNEIRVKAGASIDYESAASHQLSVTVTDASGLSLTNTVTITVIDENEPPSDLTVAGGTVQENAPAGTVVATLGAVDPDAGSSFTYSLDADPSGLFEVVGNEIRVKAGASLDYETATSHDLTVTVTDNGGLSYTAPVTITVTDQSGLTIVGTPGKDVLIGTGEEDSISGLGGSDILDGGAGNDVLDGGTGNDTMSGGAGDDTYIVNAAGDTVTEAADEGTDTVQSSVDYTLGSNVENLILTGSGNRSGTGNSLDNTLTGNSGNNVLDGGAGNDTMSGGAGNDTYVVDAAGDTVTEAAGEGTDTVQSSVTYTLGSNVENLTLTGSGNINGTGNSLDNELIGNAGNNMLDGGAGNDDMSGGAGDDTYIVDASGDSVSESSNQGTDTVLASVSFALSNNVENLTLTGSGNIDATGNTLDNTLTGNAGNNVLDGGNGNDTMSGGAGDDTYIVNAASDTVIEAADEGTDTVQASADYTLGANIENLTLTGGSSIDGTGNALDNTLIGNSRSNVLDGGAGNDTMIGGDGSDTYVVDAVGDTVTEAANEGTDTVQASVSYTLGTTSRT